MILSRAGVLACFTVLFLAGGLVFAHPSNAQSAGFKNDSSEPLQVSSDSLKIDPDAGSAILDGAVRVSQGDFSLQADHVEVFYGDQEISGQKDINRIIATGNVKLTSGSEKAEAQQATYDVSNDNILMRGSVLLTQGDNLLAGDRATINLDDGSAQVEGNVRTVLQPKEITE